MKNLFISLKDLPGILTEMAEALSEAGINIEGICQVTYEGKD